MFSHTDGTTMAQHVSHRLEEYGRRITLSEAVDMAHRLECPLSCVSREAMAHWSIEFEDGSMLSYWDRGPTGRPMLTTISICCAEASFVRNRGWRYVVESIVLGLATGGVALLLMDAINWLCK